MNKIINVFISYDSKDKRLYEKLVKQLSPLIRSGRINLLNDKYIRVGVERKQAINAMLAASHLTLLLVSPDFIHSEQCYSEEMIQAMKQYDMGKTRVVPIVLRPVDYKQTPFAKLQGLPANGLAVTQLSTQDEAFSVIVEEIDKVIEDLYRETKIALYNRIQPLSRRLSAILLAQNIPGWKAENQQLENLIINDHLEISQITQLLYDLIYKMTGTLEKRKEEIDGQLLDITSHIESQNNLREIAALLDNAAIEIGKPSKQLENTVKTFARDFYKNFSGEIEHLITSYQIKQPVMKRELLFSRKDAVHRVVEELMIFITTELDIKFRKWQSTTLQAFLVTKAKQEADQVNLLLSRLDMALEDILLPTMDFDLKRFFDVTRDDLTLYVDYQDIYVGDSSILATLSELANDPHLSDGDLSILKLVLMILAALFSFRDAPAKKTNERIKSIVGQEFKKMISKSSSKRVDVIVRIVSEETKRQIDPIKEAVLQARNVTTRTLQEQERHLIIERERLQMKVDQENQELTAVLDELNAIKEEIDVIIQLDATA